jgi:hypothetical protein
MDFRKLCIAHAAVTLAAAVVLVMSPGLIPGMVGVHVDPGAYLLCYLLAAAELGLAVLSFGARNLQDVQFRKLVAASCVAFHASSAVLEVFAFTQGVGALVLANVFVRVVVVALFLFYGGFAGRR